MSGIGMMMLASSFGQVLSNSFSSSTTANSTGVSQASVVFNSDGTVTSRGGNATSGYTYTYSNWYSATPAVGVGNVYWISLNGGAWDSLAAGYSDTLTSTNAIQTDGYRIASDSGGVNVVGSGNVSLKVANGF